MLKVSIIIVNWNTKDYLVDCLSSIPKGAGEVPYEIIIVDNASCDDSAGFIEKNFPTVKLIRNSANIGFANACNQGAGSAMGEYLLFLNPDTVLLENSLKNLVLFSQTQKDAVVVGPQLINKDGSIQNSVRGFPDLKYFLIKDTILKKLFPQDKKERLFYKLPKDIPSTVDQVSGAAFLIKKDVWQKFGGMDKRFFMFYEEVDLCRRLRDYGYNIYYLPTAKIVHLGGGSRHKDKSSVFYYSVRSMFLYLKKYEPHTKLFWFKFVYKPLFLINLLTEINKKPKQDFIRQCLVDFIKI